MWRVPVTARPWSAAGGDTTLVSTAAGRLRGRALGRANAYLGIPYAAPPVGGLRFAAPEPRQAWTGVRDATAFGPAAPQPDRPIGLWSHGPIPQMSEDCLSLNVWAPARRADRARPVLVWIHGGGWALGFSASPVADGGALAVAADVVVVTINYRLGSAGWLNHEHLGANWGMRDQALALRWVHDNVERFGGDADAVTLAGQSAGAGSVLHLLSSPLAAGLFGRVIAQSPPLGELTVPRARGTAWAHALSARVGHGGGDSHPTLDLDALRTCTPEQLVDAHEALLATPAFRGTRGGAMPVTDPATLPDDPRAVPAASPQIPVIVGTADDEATFLFRAAGRRLELDAERLRTMVAHLPDVAGEDAAQAEIDAERAQAPAGGDEDTILCRLTTRHLFSGPVREWADARAAAGGDVFRYRIAHRGPDPWLGATHTIDVPLLFGTYAHEVGARVAGAGSATQAVSDEIVGAWREFLHGGEPWHPTQERAF